MTQSAVRGLNRAWNWLRQVSGDAAYETYLKSHRRRRHAPTTAAPLTREEFYLDSLRRKYTGVTRCC